MKRVVIALISVAVMVSLILGGCAKPAAAPAPEEKALRVRDVPELQELVARGNIDPNLPMNPMEGLGIKPDGTQYIISHAIFFKEIDTCAQGTEFASSLIARAGFKEWSVNAEAIPENQIAFMEDILATQQTDGVIICCTNEAALAPVVSAVYKSGIPVVCFDFDAFTEDKLCYVQHNFDAPGIGSDTLGQVFVDHVRETGEPMKIIECWINRGVDSSQRRHKGFHLAVDQEPRITVIESIDTFYSDETTANVVIDLITADPEISGVFVQGGGGAGCIEGLRAIGRLLPVDDPQHVMLALGDMETAAIDNLLEGTVDAVSSHGWGDMPDIALQILINYMILGIEPPSKNISVPMVAWTRDNVLTEYLYGVPGYPLLPRGRWDLWPPADFSALGVEVPTKEKRMELKGY